MNINKSRTSGSSLTFKSLLFLFIGVCILISGCKGSETIWSGNARSPNGEMTAIAHAIANSGFGINGIETAVYLKLNSGSQSPTLILALADGSDSPDDAKVEMQWLTPKHLELTYKGNRSLYFQAVKCYGIDISVRDLSTSTMSASQ